MKPLSHLERQNKTAQPCKETHTNHLIKCKLLPPSFWSQHGNVFPACPSEERLKQLYEPTQAKEECVLASSTTSVNDLKEYKTTENVHRNSD